MPPLVRKLLIFAAVDGLILQPAPSRNLQGSTTQQAIKINYDGSVQPVLRDGRDEETAAVSLESQGIIGKWPSRLRLVAPLGQLIGAVEANQ